MQVSHADKHLSIKLTRFFLKVVGFWRSENHHEQMIMDVALAYTIAAIVFAIAVEGMDLYYCWGDFNAVTYNACATMPLVIVLVKTSVFMIQRKAVLELITFTQENFWRGNYDEFGMNILEECESRGVILIYTFTFLVNGTVVNYLLAPIVESLGKNETDRLLPFKLWVDLPLTTSPYYEITFTIQALSTIHSGICFFCFDNFLCILNIHAAGQFKILHHRLEGVCDKYIEKTKDTGTDSTKIDHDTYDDFKECVNQHQILIWYVEKVESVFTLIILSQMIVSSLLMCLTGFQVVLAAGTVVRRLIFVALVSASFTQLLLFTWTCNEITVQSTLVAEAAYQAQWYCMPYQGAGKLIRDGVLLVMARARRPCQLTAGKFSPMSLETFTGILSTALSYFTLLRQLNDEGF